MRILAVALVCLTFAMTAWAEVPGLTPQEQAILAAHHASGKSWTAGPPPVHYIAPGIEATENQTPPSPVPLDTPDQISRFLEESRPSNLQDRSVMANGNFETGTLTGWTTQGNLGLFGYTCGGGSYPADAYVTSPGTWDRARYDKCLNRVFKGQHSAQLGDMQQWAYHESTEPQCSSIYQDVVIPPGVMTLTFSFAALGDNPGRPGHGAGLDPYFNMKVDDLTTSTSLYDLLEYTTEYDPSIPCSPWCGGTGTAVYRCWATVTLSLGAAYDGHTLRVSLLASDCQPAGHWFMAFLDDVDVIGATRVGVNKDVQNNTHQIANDIEIVLQGSYVLADVEHYDGNPENLFANFTVTPYAGGNTLLRWSHPNNPVLDGGIAHVGFEVPGASASILGAGWTRDSVGTGCVHQVATYPYRWNTPGGGVTFRNQALLCESVPLYAGGTQIEWHATEVSLADLNRFTDRHPMRTDTIPQAPIYLAPGSATNVNMMAAPAGAHFGVVIHRVGSNASLSGPDVTKDFWEFAVPQLESHLYEITCWGGNQYGQCTVPEPNLNFVAVSAGGGHSLGIKSDGTIVAWGYDGYGECDVPTPNANFISCSAGRDHSLGIKSDGTIVAWGKNDAGQCDLPMPNDGFVAVAGGYAHSMALASDGRVVAWGSNSSGQCNVPSPNSGFAGISAGGSHSLGIKSDGTIVAWGSNASGQCTVPSPNSGYVAVSAGLNHSLGLKSDGTIVAWGSNTYGQCTVPSPNTGFVSIAAGFFHSLGLKSDGTIVAWGYNGNGQCNPPSPNADFVALAGGHYHSVGLRRSAGAIVPDTDSGGIPDAGLLRILSVSPNPIGMSAEVSFETRESGPVSMTLHDVGGRRVMTTSLGSFGPGRHAVRWDTRRAAGLPLASGVYFLRLEGVSGKPSAVRVLLIR
jgi:hypothetical protein